MGGYNQGVNGDEKVLFADRRVLPAVEECSVAMGCVVFDGNGLCIFSVSLPGICNQGSRG